MHIISSAYECTASVNKSLTTLVISSEAEKLKLWKNDGSHVIGVL